MSIKALPVPTEVKGLKIVNKRFPRVWETVERLTLARKSKFCIEALALSINLLKYYLTLVIEMYLKQNEAKDKKVNNILKGKKDVSDLVNYAIQVNILSKSESKRIASYWNSRSKTIHNFINGVIKYEDVCTELDNHFELCMLVFNKAFEIKVGPAEKVGGQFRKKLTLIPRRIGE